MAQTVVATMLAVVVALVLAGCSSTDDTTRDGLPADFPAAAIPLVDGAVISAQGSGDHWAVTIQAQATAGNPLEAAVTKLTDASFTESNRQSTDGSTVVTLSAKKDDKTYWVTVGTTPSAATGGTSVFYQVSTA